jgi:uncharacterized membrane protein YbhN (UPF0104 family)
VGEPGAPSAARSRHWLIRSLGWLIAAAAVAFCVRAIVEAWPQVRASLADAGAGWLGAAFGCSAAAMIGLGLLWWRCLTVFGVPTRPADAVTWYFGGELGKYLPGGVWAVVGRGELAWRSAGISRGTGYATTLLSYACMTLAAGLVCGVLAPVAAADRHGLGWGWLLLVLVPLGLVASHPAVLQRVLDAARRLTGGRVDLTAPSWPAMLRLIAWAIPTWLLVGAAATLSTAGLHLAQNPARVAFAAVAAWIIGFLAVPVPVGAGVREVVFLVLCGLPAGPGTAVAAIARAMLMVVDGVGGVLGLWLARPRQALGED